jgi:uncharacterized protein (DUF488 family)
MAVPFYTIGHATRPMRQFVDLLRASGITLVADVRTVPRSRTNPQYNADMLPEALAAFHIGYIHIAELGGLRGKQHDVSQSVNAFWKNKSFHNYADYAMGGSFHIGLTRLRHLCEAQRCAIMCAETLWWRCHRRIIADYLMVAGETVFHILGPGKIEPARMTAGVRERNPAVLAYPA